MSEVQLILIPVVYAMFNSVFARNPNYFSKSVVQNDTNVVLNVV